MYPKLVKDFKVPFKLEGVFRVDDTPVHKAIREALANCLVNTDFFFPRGVVIKKTESEIIFENPGSIRTGKAQMLKGGDSDPRNKTLMKMFNMIGIGERAGSGVPSIYDVWKSEGFKTPIVEESYAPDRTKLILPIVGTILGVDNTQTTPKLHPSLDDIDNKIISLLKEHPEYSQSRVSRELGENINKIKTRFIKLKKMELIKYEGTSQNGRWIILHQ